MSDPDERRDTPGPTDDAGWSELASSGASITPDPFLAEVARIPSRAEPPGAMPRPGDTLGRFVLRAELGRGGMGVVFAAEDVTLGREVALKVLPSSGDEARRRRFLREARSAAALSDPGIATVFDVGEAGGWVFIAMELIRGETLRARLERQPEGDRSLPAAEARRIARAIARALGRAHARGVIHRDLKPENVMIAEDGQVKLLDFGLAKIAAAAPLPGAASATETAEGHILGTPGYMSPEQAKGRPVDARSDVFAFGVLLYELITGRRPFSGATPVELFIAIDRDEPPLPTALRPGTPGDLERVVLRCLRKDPAARYADASAILPDLEGAPAPRQSQGWIAVAVGLAVLAGGALISVGARDGESRGQGRPAPPEVPPPPAAPPPPELPAQLGPSAAAPGAPTAVTDLPVPTSTSPEAVAQYRAALAAFRVGGEWSASLLRALELDPKLAVAHLQFASTAVVMAKDLERPREHFRRAEALRAALGERDRGLLDAIEPVVRRQPAEWHESIRRLHALADRYPGDAQLWYLLGTATANYSDFDAALRFMERAIGVDPGFARAHVGVSAYHAYGGRFDEARRAIDRCIEAAPGSTLCLHARASVLSNEGDCEGMERVVRSLIASGEQPAPAYTMLARALAARGQPAPTVREALKQGEQAVSGLPASLAGDLSRRWVPVYSVRAHLLSGDLEAAEREARALGETVAAASRTQSERGRAALLHAQALEESGRAAEAGKVALDFLDRRDAWEPDPGAEDIALATDATPSLLLLALRSGAIDRAGLSARRDPWLRGWTARLTPVSRSYLWLHGHAAVVDSAADAGEALAALPGFEPLPPYRPETLVDAAVGRTYLLAGRADEAIRWLTQATRTCVALDFPVEHTRAHLWLGQAREAKGDTRGACAAYGVVLDRWGAPRSRSVTADAARERARALGCGR